jgi:tRNA-dihydrouridine synthase
MVGACVARCLEQNLDILTPACRERITDLIAQAGEVVRLACQDDMNAFCPALDLEQGSMGQCLMANKARLSEACRMAMAEANFHPYGQLTLP